MKVLPASSPVVTSERVMVAMTDEYERAGCEVMTLRKSLRISNCTVAASVKVFESSPVGDRVAEGWKDARDGCEVSQKRRRNDRDQIDERTRVFLLLDKEAGAVLRKEACLSQGATVGRHFTPGPYVP
jgi:hypothetical protein